MTPQLEAAIATVQSLSSSDRQKLLQILIQIDSLQEEKQAENRDRLARVREQFGFNRGSDDQLTAAANPRLQDMTREEREQTVQTAIQGLKTLRQKIAWHDVPIQELRAEGWRF
jgi:hypothetical protein